MSFAYRPIPPTAPEARQRQPLDHSTNACKGAQLALPSIETQAPLQTQATLQTQACKGAQLALPSIAGATQASRAGHTPRKGTQLALPSIASAHSWARWGGVLCAWLLLAGCFQPRHVRHKGRSFAMKPQDARCLRFQDQRTGLRFCVPPETQLQAFSKAQQDKERFEARLRIPQTGIVIYVRKDKLPTELPEGALDGRWLKRYGESYARRRGLRRMKHLRSHILKRKRLRFLGADGAVWLAFPLQGDEGFVWEEVLILARNPSTRYVVSLRMGAQDRSPARRYALRQLLTLFLKALRLGNT